MKNQAGRVVEIEIDQSTILEIEDLRVEAEGHEILKGVNLAIAPGTVHALMGPNGSGKSTLAGALAGNPSLKITGGRLRYKGDDLAGLSADERARRGIFLAFQHPEEVPGVTLLQLIRAAVSQRQGVNLAAFQARMLVNEKLEELEMERSFADRYVNEGFSGGEKKRAEVLQMSLLEPDLAILDETDSGLDIDALKIVANGVNHVRTIQPTMAALVITHYERILKYLEPDIIHIMIDGRIVESGGQELADRITAQGYESFRAAS